MSSITAFDSSMPREIRVEYIRDELIEEFHTGLLQFGTQSEDTHPYYLRSCAKPLQASLLIDYGIDLTLKELAFCSGSHAGEDCHIETAKGILQKFELEEDLLQCGIHPPLSRSMQDKMLIKGKKASALHNNCSGKHLGFLAICKEKGWDINTYYLPQHPLQKEVQRKIYELCEIPSNNNYPVTTDGCGVPIVSTPLKNLIIGYKNLNTYYPQLVKAIMDNPYIYGGEDRLDTEIIQNSENIMAKVGAGGLCIVLNTKTNEGFVVKMNDASMPVRRITVLEVLKNLGWTHIPYDNEIKALNGKIVGKIIVTI